MALLTSRGPLLTVHATPQAASVLPCYPACHAETVCPTEAQADLTTYASGEQGEATKPIFLSDRSLPPGSKSQAMLRFSSQSPFEKSLDEFQLGCTSQSRLVPFPPGSLSSHEHRSNS